MRQMLHIFILAAFLGGIIAPACGFAWGNKGAGKYSVVEICTSQGIESRVVKTDDSDTPNHQMAEECQFCFANANMVSFLPDMVDLDKSRFIQEKIKFQSYEVAVLSRQNIQAAPRGPPALI